MTTTTRPFQDVEGRPVQLIEIEGTDGRWSRVRSDSPAAKIAAMTRSNAEIAEGIGRLRTKVTALAKQMAVTTPPAVVIHSFAELETASLSGTLRKSEAYAFIERGASELASRHSLSKSEAVTQYCQKNPKVYAAYRAAKPDPAPVSPPQAEPAARTIGAAEQQLDTKARAFAATNGVTFAVAMTTVAGLKENADLYKRYLAEQRGK